MSTAPGGSTAPYQAFTTKFDRIARIEDFQIVEALPFGLGTLQARFRRAALRRSSAMRRLTTKRAAGFERRWRAGHALGARPLNTLLLDHSGSLRGKRANAMAVAIEIVGSALERSCIAFDVLGYTTRNWKGGESRQAWIKRGKPSLPGRLCDLLHIIYRDAVAPRNDWADDLIALMNRDLLKENVDGEALLWAHGRSEAFRPTTWICLVVSDGSPVDDSTIMANGGEKTAWYLAAHLEEVVTNLAAAPNVRLGGLGVLDDNVQSYPVSVRCGALGRLPLDAFDLLERLIWRK